MKKTLLGTTALVAVGLLAGPALASDPLKVTVGGNVVTGFYVVDADDFGPLSYQDTKVAVVARNIDIKAEGTLDNGLVAGVDAKLMLGSDFGNANANADGSATFRQLFAYLEGGFGRFEIGGTDGAAYKMHYTSPWFVPGNGVDSPNILNNPLLAGTTGIGLRQSTFSLLATDANKVSYFTPRLAGFQLGLSFTPEASLQNVTANGLVVLPDAGVTNAFEAALNYAGTFGGVDLGLDGFYTTADAGAAFTSRDPQEYGFGANIGFAGFTLGGAYYKSEDIFNVSVPVGPGDVEQRVWTAGLKYATGPWTVGVAYLNSDLDTAGFSPSSDSWQVGGGYNLGSGVDIGLDIQKSKIDTPVGSYDAQSAGIVLAIAF